MIKLAASAASPDYIKFQAMIKSAASAASLRGGRASGRLDHGLEKPPGTRILFVTLIRVVTLI